MENQSQSLVGKLCGISISYMRRFLFDVLSVGPIPSHIAFILDGNRRYARKWKLGEGMGHRAGFLSLMSLMKYCYELGIKYITIYAFSIDNFRRKPHEVKYVMDLMLEKIEGMLKEESIVEQYGVRVYFIGNLKLLNDTVRDAAEKAMKATAKNNRSILLICVAYTSTDEIVHAAQESCEQLWNEMQALKPNVAPNGKISEISEEKEEKTEEKKQADANGKTQDKESEKKQEGSIFGKLVEMGQKTVDMGQKTVDMGIGNLVKAEEMTIGKVVGMSKEKVEETSIGKLVEMGQKTVDTGIGNLVKVEEMTIGKVVGMSKEKVEETGIAKLVETGKEKLEEMSIGKLVETSIAKVEEKIEEIQNGFGKEMKEFQPIIKLSDIERNMYMGLAPDVDILVRTSGETRLSNFLLWQTWNGLLYSPKALWPEIGLKHLIWAILNFQRAHPLFEKRKKQF